jgi:hypothetical protein
MSLTLTRVVGSEDVWGRTRTVVYDVQFDTSYPLTNGYTINASDVGLKNFLDAALVGGNKASGAVLPHLEFSLGLPASSAVLRLFLPTGGATAPATLTAPVAGATTSGAITVTNGAISIAASTATPASGATAVTSTSAQPAIPVTFGAITQATTTASIAAGTAGALTAGIGKEVGNATDASSITARFRFFGI